MQLSNGLELEKLRDELASCCSNEIYAGAPSGPAISKPPFEIEIVDEKSHARMQIEDFIRQGFRSAFGANVTISMPALLGIKRGSYKAALGIRWANGPLFVEQYLDKPIEKSLQMVGRAVPRDKIAEIGGLFSLDPRFTLPLLLVAGMSLYFADCRNLVFLRHHSGAHYFAR